MKILKDENNNIFKANIVSNIPEEYTDITDLYEADESLDGVASEYLEVAHQAAIAYSAPDGITPEKWSKEGEEDVYADPNDESWSYTAEAIEVPEVLASPEKWIASKKSDADKDMRNKILEELRYNRSPLLAEADVEINKLEDASADSSAWRAYRQALRDVPAAYIKADGDPKVATDSIDLDNFSWPEKP